MLNLSFALSPKITIDASGLSRIGPVLVSSPQLLDPDGNRIDTVRVGQQAVLKVLLQNIQDTVQPFVVLAEVRDGSGVTQYLAWQSGNLKSSGNYTFETSWMPTSGCVIAERECYADHQIRAFAVSDLVNPQVLSTVEISQYISVMGKLEQGNKVYRLMLEAKEYEIEYSIESGNIRQIYADPNFGSLMLQLGDVLSDTELTVTLPKELMDIVFAIGSYELSSGEVIKYSPEFAFDSQFIDPISVQKTENSTTWIIPIQR